MTVQGSHRRSRAGEAGAFLSYRRGPRCLPSPYGNTTFAGAVSARALRQIPPTSAPCQRTGRFANRPYGQRPAHKQDPYAHDSNRDNRAKARPGVIYWCRPLLFLPAISATLERCQYEMGLRNFRAGFRAGVGHRRMRRFPALNWVSPPQTWRWFLLHPITAATTRPSPTLSGRPWAAQGIPLWSWVAPVAA